MTPGNHVELYSVQTFKATNRFRWKQTIIVNNKSERVKRDIECDDEMWYQRTKIDDKYAWKNSATISGHCDITLFPRRDRRLCEGWKKNLKIDRKRRYLRTFFQRV